MVRFFKRMDERGIRVTFPDEQAESFFFLPASPAEDGERKDAQGDCAPVHTFHRFLSIGILPRFDFLPDRV